MFSPKRRRVGICDGQTLIAAQRLIRSGISVAEAARKCGFGDYTSFYRAYRKQFGEAPKAAGAMQIQAE